MWWEEVEDVSSKPEWWKNPDWYKSNLHTMSGKPRSGKRGPVKFGPPVGKKRAASSKKDSKAELEHKKNAVYYYTRRQAKRFAST